MQRTGGGFGMYGSEAEIFDMVGAAGFVEQDVPVGPGHGAVVEVVNHVFAVLFAPGPLIEGFPAERVVAGFGEEQVFARERFSHPFHIVILPAAVPDFIPVKSDAPDISGGFFIAQQGVGALIEQVAVVVPGNEFLLAEFVSF